MDAAVQIKGDLWYNQLRLRILDSVPVGQNRAHRIALPLPDESLGIFLRHVLAQIAAKNPTSDRLEDTNEYQQSSVYATEWIARPAARTPEKAKQLLQIFDTAGIDLRVPYPVDFFGTPPPAQGFTEGSEIAMLPDERYIDGNIGIHPQCAGIATAETTMGSDPYKIYNVASGVKVLPLFFFNEGNPKACNVLIFGPLRAYVPQWERFESRAVYVTPPAAWSVSGAVSGALGLDVPAMNSDYTEFSASTGPILGGATEAVEGVRQMARGVYDRFGGRKKRTDITHPYGRAAKYPNRKTKGRFVLDYPHTFAARNQTDGLVDGLKQIGKLLIADDVTYNLN